MNDIATNLEMKRQSGGFRWTSGTKRLGHPIFWYCRQGSELWFVNSSNDVLTSVTSSGAGSATLDGEETVTTSPSASRVYINVQPNEGVLVDTFDDFYDLDFLIYTQVDVLTSDGRCLQLARCGKGGSGTCRLLSPGQLEEA